MTVIYRIDGEDRIFYVNEAWGTFARENQGEAVAGIAVVGGRLLWDFVADLQTVHIFKLMLDKVRGKQCTLQIPIFCDSPETVRELSLELSPLANGSVEFRSRTISIRKRPPVLLLDPKAERSDDFICICSYCKKIRLAEDNWTDIDEALRTLDFFRKEPLPGLSHGVCPSCLAQAIKMLEEPA